MYCSIVSSVLEYGSIIRDPFIAKDKICKVEWVQRKFLKVIAFDQLIDFKIKVKIKVLGV